MANEHRAQELKEINIALHELNRLIADSKDETQKREGRETIQSLQMKKLDILKEQKNLLDSELKTATNLLEEAVRRERKDIDSINNISAENKRFWDVVQLQIKLEGAGSPELIRVGGTFPGLMPKMIDQFSELPRKIFNPRPDGKGTVETAWNAAIDSLEETRNALARAEETVHKMKADEVTLQSQIEEVLNLILKGILLLERPSKKLSSIPLSTPDPVEERRKQTLRLARSITAVTGAAAAKAVAGLGLGSVDSDKRAPSTSADSNPGGIVGIAGSTAGAGAAAGTEVTARSPF